jgi:hypothetical protein
MDEEGKEWNACMKKREKYGILDVEEGKLWNPCMKQRDRYGIPA